MVRHAYGEFSAQEQRQIAAVCRLVGFAPQDFEITDEVNDASASPSGTTARQVKVRRFITGAECVYEDDETSPWLTEFESDLECGLFGPVSVQPQTLQG